MGKKNKGICGLKLLSNDLRKKYFLFPLLGKFLTKKQSDLLAPVAQKVSLYSHETCNLNTLEGVYLYVG